MSEPEFDLDACRRRDEYVWERFQPDDAERDRHALLALVDRLGEALADLHAEQNGPPLLRKRDKEAWEKAMADTEDLLVLLGLMPPKDEKPPP